jgi:hypothetical protein
MTEKELKECVKIMFKCLNDIGWWNFFVFDSLDDCCEAKEWTEKMLKVVKNK